MTKKYFYYVFLLIGIVLFGLILFSKPQKYSLPFEEGQQEGGQDDIEILLLPSHTKPLLHRQQTDEELAEMIVDIEDKRFFQHFWVDVFALMRALRQYVRGEGHSGASTIDQQMVKLHEQAYHRSWKQKIHEILSAVLLQSNGKDAILTAYLNSLPFPYGRRGVEAWCQLLFGVSCKHLTHEEKLFLIATYQTGKNPYDKKGFEQVQQRADILAKRDKIISSPNDETWGVLTTKENHHWIVNTGEATEGSPDIIGRDVKAGVRFLHPLPKISPYDASLMAVIQQDMKAGGRLFFDLEKTQTIERILKESASWRASIDAKDCCVLEMDNAGHLIAWATCRHPSDKDGSFVNGCFQKRQVGSLMKPLVYLYAIQKLHRDMKHLIKDEPVHFDLWNGARYRPQNFDLKYHGEVSLGEALASSLNIPAVKILHQAGLEGYFWFFQRLRKIAWESKKRIAQDASLFNAERLWLSVALGTYELSPYEVIRVWRLISPSALPVSWNENDRQWFKNLQKSRQEITKILADSSYRIHGFSNPRALDHPGRAIKTGTSRHFVDGWMCGTQLQASSWKLQAKNSAAYSSSSLGEGEVLCVWMGNYEGESMKVSGADSAGILRWLVEEGIR